MHFALPPRKSSHPPPYARSSKSSPARRKQIQLGALVACATLALIYLATRIFSSSPVRVPPGTPETVIVTLIDPEYMSKDYVSRIKENRVNYANRHGENVRRQGRQNERLISSRLRCGLPQGRRLRAGRLPSQLGTCSVSTPRHDFVSTFHVLLCSVAPCPNHESRSLSEFPLHGTKTARVADAEGQTGCTSG